MYNIVGEMVNYPGDDDDNREWKLTRGGEFNARNNEPRVSDDRMQGRF